MKPHTPSTTDHAASPGAKASTPGAARHWMVDFMLLAAIWGSSFMFMRMGALEMGPFPTAGIRIAIAALFLLPFALYQGQGALLRRHWKITFVIGVLNSAIPFACFTYALLSISTGLSSILNATVPLFGAVIAWVWLKDRPHGSRIVGLLIGFMGVSMLAWAKASFTPDAQGHSTGWPIMACLLASVCYGISASATKKYMAGIPPLVAATGSLIGAALAMAPLTVWYWPEHPIALRAWLAVTVLGVLCTGIAYTVFFRLLERAGPAKTLSVTFAVPVFAIFYGVVLLGEVVTPWMVGCGLVIIAGTTLSTGLVTLRK